MIELKLSFLVFSKFRYTVFGVLSSIGGSLGLYLGFSLLDGYKVVKYLTFAVVKMKNQILNGLK